LTTASASSFLTRLAAPPPSPGTSLRGSARFRPPPIDGMKANLMRLQKYTFVSAHENAHFGGRPPREGGMTTVWRPKVRIDVPNVGDTENTDTSREESTKKGTKRKRAPKHHGPCEHGVKKRSKCKVCSACPHGRQRSRCKECGGASICEHGRRRSRCKECGGSSVCEHGRLRYNCKECGGSGICEHGRERRQCKECGGSQICEHGRRRHECKECVVSRS